jgi:hypothetical protein
VRSGRTTVEKIQQQLQQQQKDEAAASASLAGERAIGASGIVNALPVIYSSERDVQYLIDLMEFVKNYIGYNCITDADAMFDLSSDNGAKSGAGGSGGKASALEDGADADADEDNEAEEDEEDAAESVNGSSNSDDDDTSAIAQTFFNTFFQHPAAATAATATAVHPAPNAAENLSVFQRMMMTMPPVFGLPPTLSVAAPAASDEDEESGASAAGAGMPSKKRRRLTMNQHQ